MSKIKYLIFSIFVGFVFVNGVYASELKLTSNSNEIVAGDVFSAKLELDITEDGSNIDYCRVLVAAYEELEFQEVQALNSWTITDKNINTVLDMSVKNYQNNLYG